MSNQTKGAVRGRLPEFVLSVATAAENEERDDNDPDPVVVKERAKATGVASTVRVHKKDPF